MAPAASPSPLRPRDRTRKFNHITLRIRGLVRHNHRLCIRIQSCPSCRGVLFIITIPLFLRVKCNYSCKNGTNNSNALESCLTQALLCPHRRLNNWLHTLARLLLQRAAVAIRDHQAAIQRLVFRLPRPIINKPTYNQCTYLQTPRRPCTCSRHTHLHQPSLRRVRTKSLNPPTRAVKPLK